MSGEEVDVNYWLIEAAGKDGFESARNYKSMDGESFFNSSKHLHIAVEGCFYNVCKFLIEERGVDVNELNSFGRTPLHLACQAYDDEKEEMAEIVQLLLNNGANISISDRNGDLPLHLAAGFGWKETVNILLKAGTDVDIRNRDGSSPLHEASRGSCKDVVEFLCQNGANLDARNLKGWSPLHEAACSEFPEATETVATLVKFGANVNAPGTYMETALHCSAFDTEGGKATILLDNGCDINIETSSGKTALDTFIVEAKLNYHFIDETLIKFFGEINDKHDITDDDNFDHLQSVQILKQHLVKLKTAKLFVNLKNLSHLVRNDFTDFEGQCQQEISAAKNEELHPGITLFDILSAGVHPTYAKNKPLMEALDGFNWDSFPLYKCIILNNVKKSKLRLDLLESGEKWFGILLRTSKILNDVSVPAEILSMIVSFLSNEELEALITCGEGLQRQLVHNASDIGSSTS